MEKGVNRNTLLAAIGDTVLFKRKDSFHEGIVYKIQDNSVLVQIKAESMSKLGIDNCNTVVAHKNYSLKKR